MVDSPICFQILYLDKDQLGEGITGCIRRLLNTYLKLMNNGNSFESVGLSAESNAVKHTHADTYKQTNPS